MCTTLLSVHGWCVRSEQPAMQVILYRLCSLVDWDNTSAAILTCK